ILSYTPPSAPFPALRECLVALQYSDLLAVALHISATLTPPRVLSLANPSCAPGNCGRRHRAPPPRVHAAALLSGQRPTGKLSRARSTLRPGEPQPSTPGIGTGRFPTTAGARTASVWPCS